MCFSWRINIFLTAGQGGGHQICDMLKKNYECHHIKCRDRKSSKKNKKLNKESIVIH